MFSDLNRSMGSFHRAKIGTFRGWIGLRIQRGSMESSSPAARVIPHEQLRANLQQYCFSERMAGMLQREATFRELKH
jgi:hypothetical protein